MSCPNVADGAVFSHCPRLAEIAQAAVASGAVALAISNTIPALHIDVDTGRATLGMGTEGWLRRTRRRGR